MGQDTGIGIVKLFALREPAGRLEREAMGQDEVSQKWFPG